MPAAPASPRSVELSALQQKLFDNAQQALAQDHLDYVLAASAALLEARPDYLPARQLQRFVLLSKAPPQRAWLRRLLGCLTELRLSAARTKMPDAKLRLAQQLLLKNPRNCAALRLLADAASALGWLDTAIFAYEAIRELEPQHRANLLALGEALLDAQRAGEALHWADFLLAQNPLDAQAQALMRKASIAQTMDKGNWAEAGDFRSKLKQS